MDGQTAAYAKFQREHLAALEQQHAINAILCRWSSWDPTNRRLRPDSARPVQYRATRTGRVTTSRRAAAMSSSTSGRGGDDGGDDPPGSPFLTKHREDLLWRDEQTRIRRRKQGMADLRALGQGWA